MNLGKTYHLLLQEIKHKISSSRLEAIQAVNRKLIHLYWEIGKLIHQKQEIHGWGKSVVEKLSMDLQMEFPQRSGLSSRNLWEMRKFFKFYQNKTNLQQLVAEIPWGHNLLIMRKLSDDEEIFYYLTSTAKFGWTRSVLLNQLKADAYHRRSIEATQHNFKQTLEPFWEEQAIESIKSSYNLEFLGISQPVKEKASLLTMDKRLLKHATKLDIEVI